MLTNTDKKPNQGLSARQWSNRHVFESWNELGSVRAVTARCWALGPADRSLGQLENALQNLSAPFSLDKLFYCSHTVGFHLASWLMIGWEHVGYCYSFIQQRYSDWKCSRVIEHPVQHQPKHDTQKVHTHTQMIRSMRGTISMWCKWLCGMTLATVSQTG